MASLVTRDPEYAFSNFSYREGEADAQLVWHASPSYSRGFRFALTGMA